MTAETARLDEVLVMVGQVESLCRRADMYDEAGQPGRAEALREWADERARDAEVLALGSGDEYLEEWALS